MLKKALYAVMATLVLLFIYNTYIKKDTLIKAMQFIKESIETDNIKYQVKNGYQIFAKNVLENKEEQSTTFKMARALFNDMQIKGKEALIDKYKNMFFKGDILGTSGDGWEFKTDELKYDNMKEKYFSKGKIEAENKNKKVTVVGDALESNKDFTVITISGNVKLLGENINLTAQKVIYDRMRNIVRLNDNINFNAKDYKTQKGVIDKISGNFNYGIYDMKSKQLTVWSKYTVYYMGYVIKADNMIYYAENGNLNAYDNVEINRDGAVVKLNSIFYNNETKKITLSGPINGNMEEYNFKADYGEVDTEKDTMFIANNLTMFTPENTITADEAVLDNNKKMVYVNSKYAPNITLVGADYRFYSKRAEFDMSKNIAYLPEKFEGYSGEYAMNGKTMKINTVSQKGTAEGINLKKNKDNFFADYFDFDLINKKHNFRQNVKAFYGDYTMKTNSVMMNENDGTIFINDKFTVENSREHLKMESENGWYYENKREIKTESGVKVTKDGYVITGKNGYYNMEREEGSLKQNIVIVNKKENITVKTEEILYKSDEYIRAPYTVEVVKDGNTLSLKNGEYDLKSEKGYSKFPGVMENAKDRLKVFFKSTVYDRTAGKLTFEDFKGKKEDVDFSSDSAFYDEKKRVFTMEKNATVKQKDLTGFSERFIYYKDSGDVTSDTVINIKQKNILTRVASGKININSKTLSGKGVTVTTEQGDRVRGDTIDGDYENKEFNFKGNLDAKLKDGISFTGKLAKLFFVENANKEQEITRGEIKQDTLFRYKDMYMKSDYLEIDNMKKLVFGKGNPTMKLDEGTNMTADYIYLDVDKETGTLQNGVKITGRSTETGIVNTLADKAFLKNKEKKVEMSGNVTSYQGDTKIEADRGVYDIKTQQLHGEGNIRFKYNINSNKKNEEEKKEEKKDTTTKSATDKK